AGLVAVVLTVTYVLEKSKLGYYLVAIRENQEAAAALGVDHTRAKLIAAAISAFFTALGGTYYAQFAGFIEPDVVMGMGMAIQIILMAIIGGKGTLFGPLVGAVCLVPVAEILRGEFGGGTAGLHLAVYGTLLIVIMLFVPQGIVGSIRSTIRRRARLSSVVDG
ncbi:MAG TPA: branched-chain amino acid ABC transporter permease, partial [Firmicutes bacterium]|nr:branched-chain amino acid ABC transporter permease [Bacillota bacterium]